MSDVLDCLPIYLFQSLVFNTISDLKGLKRAKVRESQSDTLDLILKITM